MFVRRVDGVDDAHGAGTAALKLLICPKEQCDQLFCSRSAIRRLQDVVKIDSKASQSLTAQACLKGRCGLGERHTRLNKMRRRCLSTVRFATGPKRPMVHVLGGEKDFFLIRGRDPRHGPRRPRQFNPVNPRRRGVPGVGWGRYYTRASTYAACAGASSILSRFLSTSRPPGP